MSDVQGSTAEWLRSLREIEPTELDAAPPARGAEARGYDPAPSGQLGYAAAPTGQLGLDTAPAGRLGLDTAPAGAVGYASAPAEPRQFEGPPTVVRFEPAGPHLPTEPLPPIRDELRGATADRAPAAPRTARHAAAPTEPPRRRFRSSSKLGYAEGERSERQIIGQQQRSWLSVRARTRLVMAVFVLGAAATMTMWWLGLWPGALDSPKNVAAGVGQVAGFLGEYLLLVQVLLMARIPWLEQTIGAPRIAAVHAVVGFTLCAMITEHIVLATYLNLPPDQPAGVGIAGVLLATRDILPATIGTALLFWVAYLSRAKVRRKIRYEVWRYLHLFAYVGIALAFLHQLTLGIHMLNSQDALLFWVGLHAAVVGVVLWYRVGRILLANLRHQVRVERVVEEGPQVWSVYLSGRRLPRLGAQAGQFFRWRFMTWDGWWQSHPLSLSAAPRTDYLRITIKEAGDYTSRIGGLEKGTSVFFSGPYGALTDELRIRDKVLLVAGGIGITPMRSLLEGMNGDDCDITLLYRARDESELVFREELEELATRRNATVHYLLGSRSDYPEGRPFGARHLRDLIPDLHQHQAYACGSADMVDAVTEGLLDAGVPAKHIHAEGFAF